MKNSYSSTKTTTTLTVFFFNEQMIQIDIFSKEDRDGQQAHGKIFNIINHQMQIKCKSKPQWDNTSYL